MSQPRRFQRWVTALAAASLAASLAVVSPVSAQAEGAAVTSAPEQTPKFTVDYFADSYPSLDAKSVFVSTPYERLTDLLNSQGTYAVVFGGPHQSSTQSAIKYIDDVAREYQIDEVYHFDPLLAGGDVDITDPVNSIAYGSNNYYKLFTDLKNQLINIDPGYTSSKQTYVFLFNKTHKNDAGLAAPIIGGVLKDAGAITDSSQAETYKHSLRALFDQAKDGAGKVAVDSRSQFDYFQTTHNQLGSDSKIIENADRDGWTLESINYDQLINLLESPGSHTIVTGGGWCPNARAVFRYLNQAAIANGVTTVYVFDVRLDGRSSALSITQDLNKFNYLDARLIDGYFGNAHTDVTNPKLPYYPGGDTTKPQQTSENRKFLNPFLFEYQKDATSSTGSPKPLTEQWVYSNASGQKEYQLTWAKTKDGTGATDTSGLTTQGLNDLKDFFANVAEHRASLVTADPGDVPRQGRASNTAADGCGDEDDLIDNSGSDTLIPTHGTQDYDVKHYDINLDYAPVVPSSQTSVTATTKITAQANKALGNISLDFRRLNITSLKVNGVAAQYQQVNIDTQDLQKLNIVAPTGIASGATFTVEVSYTTGTVDAFKEAGYSNQGFFLSKSSRGATALGEPFGSTYWFPNNNSTTDRATYKIALTAPGDLTGVSVGVLESTKPVAGTDKVTRTWVQATSALPYQVLASFGDYKEFANDITLANGRIITARNYVDRTLYNSSTKNQVRIEQQIARQGAIIAWGEQKFGAYPGVSAGGIYEYLLNADQEPITLGGIETVGRIFFTGIPGGNTLVHEYIHQWAGNSVTLDRWNDLWLNEGFATYFANVWYEDTRGVDLQQQYGSWFTANTDPEFWEVAPGAVPNEGYLFSNAAYGRGSYLLAALRTSVGEEDFAKITKQWFSTFHTASASSAQFVTHSNEITGLDLSHFFNTWLYGEGRPSAFPTATISKTVAAAPGKPTIVVAGKSAVVTWVNSADSVGSGVTGYQVTLSNGTQAVVDAQTFSHTFPGLADGSYSATVKAISPAGVSAASEASANATVGVPHIPTTPAATAVQVTTGKINSVAYGKKVSVPVTISSASATGAVIAKLGSKQVGTGKVTQGKATVAISAANLKVGKNAVTLSYAGDATHKPANVIAKIKVVKASATISTKPKKSTIKRSSKAVVTVQVKASGVKATGKVKITVSGKQITATLTNGKASVRLPKILRTGTAKITVKYLGSSTVAAAVTTTKVRVKR